MRYAANTEVNSERSRAEIQRTLERYGAEEHMFLSRPDSSVVEFRLQETCIRIKLRFPKRDEEQYIKTETGRTRKPKAAREAWEQGTRQKWRALSLMVKAKLEAVESGITTIEEEFLAHIVMPDGFTIGEKVIPRLEHMDNLPKLLTA